VTAPARKLKYALTGHCSGNKSDRPKPANWKAVFATIGSASMNRRDTTDVVIGSSMPSGTVKWFDSVKRYGFIQPDDGSADVFVHISAVEEAGLGALTEGQKIKFELVPGRQGKMSAGQLERADD
jgi:CspA family cold shock protein